MSTKSKIKILITGGCGYTGSIITQKLLNKGFSVLIVDDLWFGNYLKKNKTLKILKKDISKIEINDLKNVSAVIHLANVANDPSVKLNPLLSWQVNVLSSDKLIKLCIKAKIKKFIYASSGSVYGIKKEKKVTEKLSLLPISYYNKTKMISERVLLSYKDKIKIYCIRPATVCGLSPRMRLDVSVNMLTYQAIKSGTITVLGGKQIRPNINVNDLANLYFDIIFKNNIKPGIYNAGFENLSIKNIANMISKKTKCKIIYKKSNDPRSYRLDSSKLLKTGFRPVHNVSNTIDELVKHFNLNNLSKERCENINWMKKKGINGQTN